MLISHLELQLHSGNSFAGWGLGEFLDVGIQVPRRHLSVATGGGLQQSFVDEDVLVFSLDHVIPLGSHACHMTIDVHGLLVLHALQHGINHNEAASSTYARTDGGRQTEEGGLMYHYFDITDTVTCLFALCCTQSETER